MMEKTKFIAISYLANILALISYKYPLEVHTWKKKRPTESMRYL